jgi:hypothetical protein
MFKRTDNVDWRKMQCCRDGHRNQTLVLDRARFSSHVLLSTIADVTSASFKASRVNPKNILTELKRRNVYRAAVAYGVVAWFLTQLTTQVLPLFEIPNSAMRFVVIALVVGFPIAMLLAWIYEFTASMSLAFPGRLTVLLAAIRQRSSARSFH